ncbi:MAG: hypothetical protein ACTHNY_02000, partial [Solirubrobacterales bacterium]
MAPDGLPDPKLVSDRYREPLQPPSFEDAEPRVVRPAAEGGLDPFERARLDRLYVEIEDAAADTQIRKE